MMHTIKRTEKDRDILQTVPFSAEDLQDDFCDYSKVVVKKPWGYEYLIFQNDNVAGWILYLKKGAQTSMHCHTEKKTSLVVLEGEVACSTLHRNFEFHPGDGLLIGKGVFHQTRAATENGAFVLEIETPVNKRDLIRLRDEYGREGKGYENADQHSENIQNYNYLTFEAPQTHHNYKKCFGHCTLTFKKVENPGDLRNIFHESEGETLCVLRGGLTDSSGKIVVDVGDTITLDQVQSLDASNMISPLELLVIKKIDHLTKVSDLIVRFLKMKKVREVFVVPGDANVHLLDSIGRDEELRFICTQMENGASLAAEAYSKLHSSLGVLIVSSGASGLNALQGVANAWIDSAPLLVISGQASTDEDSDQVRQLGNKSFNIIDTVKSITKYAVKVTEPTLIRYHLEKAIALACEGRKGPVWLDIPIDIQGMTLDENDLEPFESAKEGPELSDISSSWKGKVSETLDWLQKSRRPVLLLGNGIRICGGEKLLEELLASLPIPILTSRRGADLVPEDYPLFFGRPGAYGQRRANLIIQSSDLVLSIGSRLSIPLIGRNWKAFARGAKKIVVDIDLRELKKETVSIDLPINADASEFIRELLQQLSSKPSNSSLWTDWTNWCRDIAARFPPLAEKYKKTDWIQPYFFTRNLSEHLHEKEVVIVDGGPVMTYVMQTFLFKRGQRMISSTGLELPGFALPAAVGVSFNQKRERVICLCEDRGLLLGAQEMETICRYELPVKIFVLKSRGHSYIRQIQKNYFGGRYVATDHDILFKTPSILEIAKTFGFSTYELNDPTRMDSIIEETLQREGPTLCEIRVDNQQELIPRVGFAMKEDGKWLSKPLEDMFPYLERVKLKENLLVELLSED